MSSAYSPSGSRANAIGKTTIPVSAISDMAIKHIVRSNAAKVLLSPVRWGAEYTAFNPRIRADTPARVDQSAAIKEIKVVYPNVESLALINASTCVSKSLNASPGMKLLNKVTCSSIRFGSEKTPQSAIRAARAGKIANIA